MDHSRWELQGFPPRQVRGSKRGTGQDEGCGLGVSGTPWKSGLAYLGNSKEPMK